MEMKEQIEILKERVYRSNLLLKQHNLVTLTWGNVSEIHRRSGLIAIKPSGVDYEKMKVEDIVITDLDGNVKEGNLKPSSDLLTHIEIYKAFPTVNAVVHTHSRWATIFSQAGMDIPMLGTTHADTFYGDIPCTRKMTDAEIAGDYEKETGKVVLNQVTDFSPQHFRGDKQPSYHRASVWECLPYRFAFYHHNGIIVHSNSKRQNFKCSFRA